MNWRWYLFWLKDALSGGKVRKVYNELKKDEVCFNKENQASKLNELLEYVKNNCEYYKNYELNIKKFPVMNKQIIKDNFDSIISKNYNVDNLHKMSTSGSTGTPFTVYQNSEKRNAVLAEVIYFGEKANFKFGEKELYSRIWVKQVQKSKLRKFLQNIVTFDISRLDDNSLSDLYDTLCNKKVKCMLSYASTLKSFDVFLKNNDINNKSVLKSIISGSELLNEDVRKNLSHRFGCNVYSRYSNEENGILGQDNGLEKTFLLNETNYYFEFLKLDSDEETSQGELSRIVVTDLYNTAMPMIRYDTGDLCYYSIVDGKHYITEIQGRRGDLIYSTNHIPLSLHVVTNNMWEIPNILQWKFVQLDEKRYKIILNVESNFSYENEKALDIKFKEILGNDAILIFDYIDEIPVLNSGKRKYIENLYIRK